MGRRQCFVEEQKVVVDVGSKVLADLLLAGDVAGADENFCVSGILYCDTADIFQ